MPKWFVLLFMTTCSSLVAAQTDYTVESMAQVRDFEVVRFFPETIRKSQGEHLFEVGIRYADPDDIPPQGVASRKVIYRARCDSKEMSISVVILRNIKGQTVKMITVPPGAEEFFKPQPNSREDDWIYRVCG